MDRWVLNLEPPNAVMTVIPFKPKAAQVLPVEPEHVFTMEVYQDPDGSYTYEISEYEDEERDDELIAAILYRASNTLYPMFEIELESLDD